MADTVLVTGATGAIGPTLVRHLTAHGYRVRAFARQTPETGVLPSDVSLVRGSILDADRLRDAMTGVSTVFHLAARLHAASPSNEDAAEYERVNVDGTRAVAEASERAGVGRLVFFSTISVYGPSRPPEVHDEASPLRPDSLYGRTKGAGEQVVLAARRGGGSAPLSVVLRLAAVYGSRVKGNYARLFRAIRQGRFVPVGDGLNRRTVVFDEDVASAAVLAARHPDAGGRIFNVTDGSIHTLREILEAMSVAAGRPSPRLYLPAGPVRAAAGLAEDIMRPFGLRPAVTRAAVAKVLEDVAVRGDAIQRELGFHPQVALAEGWGRVAEAHRG